jgi:uroporphyrinogen-III synthase
VSVVEVYRTVKPRGGSKKLMKLLKEEQIDGIAFTSSSTVNHFVDLLKRDNLKSHFRGIAIACIGPVTARTAKAWGMNVAIQPKEYTVPALAQAIAQYFEKRAAEINPA